IEPPPPPPPSPHQTRPIARTAIDEAEARRDLVNLRPASPRAPKPSPPPRPPEPPPAEREAEAIKPTARTSTKFTAASPRKQPEPAGGGLDLAALAEDAFASAKAPEPPPAAPAASAPGASTSQRTYGPYRLLERIAVGGMAEVFRGKRTGVEGFEKVVAVKRILSHLSDNKEFVDMFIDAAKMVAGLAHPNIVQIFDLGMIEKNYYIPMDDLHLP